MALFSKKGGKKISDIDFRIMRREERATFFEFLQKLGWVQIDQPYEIDRNWNHAKLRRAAKENAALMDADLLIETEDDKYSSSPFNSFVYYAWRRTGDSLPLPPGFTVPPLPLMQQLVMHRMQLIQQRQAQPQLQQAPMQMPPQQAPMQVPPQAAVGQQARPPVQPGQRPPGTPQPAVVQSVPQTAVKPPQQVPPQAQPQTAPKPAAVKQEAPPSGPVRLSVERAPGTQSAPQPQFGAAIPKETTDLGTPCPKCATPMNENADGSKLCPKCGTKA